MKHPMDSAMAGKATPLSGARVDRDDVLPASVVDAFLQQARLRPDAIAIHDGGRSLTYAQLDATSARVASGLRERGVARGDIVALDAGRGADAIIAMLAILRCGAGVSPPR